MSRGGSISDIISTARNSGRSFLLEHEGLQLLEALGFSTPRWIFVPPAENFNSRLLPGERVVIKVISPEIQHKSDLGGVRIVDNSAQNISGTMGEMRSKLRAHKIEGFLICEFVPHQSTLGHELLLGLRNTHDFGPVLTLGPGGIYTEHISAALREDCALSILAPCIFSDEAVRRSVENLAITPIISGALRSQRPEIEKEVLFSTLNLLLQNAADLAEVISEFEINPLVISGGRLVALDVLVKLGPQSGCTSVPARPLHKLSNLLKPQRIGIIGVSEKLNPGRIILKNLLRDNFPRDRIYVIKPACGEIDGCRCWPDIPSLPERLDFLVLAISAGQVPQAVIEVIQHEKAESLLVIPAGLEEKQGAEGLVRQMQTELWKSRSTAWRGPVINGGNCVGIRSQTGNYDTFFIPQYKLPLSGAPTVPCAVISQSGAFTVARASANAGLFNPRYLISIGNQTDLTIGDYLEYLKDESDIELFAIYIEGFKQGDGLRFLHAAQQITSSGRSVVLYAAGRTAAGSKAMASHTASVAGDYLITKELCRLANIMLVESSADFDDLLRLFALLRTKKVSGLRLAAISNAGFDCVAVADGINRFTLPPFGEETNRKLNAILSAARLAGILDVHNPLDLSPSAGDATFAEAMETVLSDDAIDVAILANVPITPALNTLPAGTGHCEDFAASPQSIVSRTLELGKKHDKAWVACIDGGCLYDPMAISLLKGGIPVFRSIDRAVRLFETYCAERMRTERE